MASRDQQGCRQRPSIGLDQRARVHVKHDNSADVLGVGERHLMVVFKEVLWSKQSPSKVIFSELAGPSVIVWLAPRHTYWRKISNNVH